MSGGFWRKRSVRVWRSARSKSCRAPDYLCNPPILRTCLLCPDCVWKGALPAHRMAAIMATPARNLYGRPEAPLWRYLRAGVLVAVVLVVCIWVGKALTGRLRDMTPDELRDKMAAAAQVAPPQPGATEEALSVLPLDQAIQQVNRMTPDQRREVMRSDAARDYINRLKPEERGRFIRETLDRGIQDQLKRYHKMNKEERKEFVAEAKKRQQEARERMDQLPAEKKEQVRKFANSENIGEVIEQASKAFLSVTTSDERAELQPLYEGALDNLKYARELK